MMKEKKKKKKKKKEKKKEKEEQGQELRREERCFFLFAICRAASSPPIARRSVAQHSRMVIPENSRFEPSQATINPDNFKKPRGWIHLYQTCVCIYIWLIYVHMYVLRIYIYVYMYYACIYIYTHTHTHTHICVYKSFDSYILLSHWVIFLWTTPTDIVVHRWCLCYIKRSWLWRRGVKVPSSDLNS